jgi:hypothetical protein
MRSEVHGCSHTLCTQAQLWCTAYLEHEECAAARGALTTAQQVMSALLSENKLLNMRLQALEMSKRGH